MKADPIPLACASEQGSTCCFWRPLFVGGLALGLWAFWCLLGWRYSPETYSSGPFACGTVEIAWLGIAGLAGVWLGIGVGSHREPWRSGVIVFLPLTLVSLMVVGRVLAGLSVQCYDVIAFVAAVGWTVMRWGKRDSGAGANRSKVWGWLLLLMTTGFGFYFLWQQIGYLNDFALWYTDAGENVRPIYNSIHNPGELFLRVNPDRPLFYDHFQPGILLFLPLGFLWSGVELVIFFQVLGTLICVLPIYWIGKHMFYDSKVAFLLGAVWLVYPSTSQFIYNSAYGFHWGTFCLPLYFFALAFWLQGRWGWAIAAAAWALLIKEEAAIVLGMFGMYLALFGKNRRAGGIMMLVCFGYFLLITGVVLPWFNGGHYQQQGYFHDLGDSKWEILISPLAKPGIFWGKLLSMPPFYFAATLLAPLLFLPLKKPSILLIGSLTFLFICLWNTPMAKSICFQYQASLLPVVFFAFVLAVKERCERGGLAQVRKTMVAAGVASVVLSIFFGNTFWSKENIAIQRLPQRLEMLKKMKSVIPRQATVVATQRLAPHLVTQKYLYLVPSLPPETDYVFFDLRDDWLSPGSPAWLGTWVEFREQLERLPRLHLSAIDDGLLLYSREGQPLDLRAVVERDHLPQDLIPASLEVAPGIQRLGYQAHILPVQKGDSFARVQVSAYHTRTAPAADTTVLRCILQVGQGPDLEEFASKFQLLGQGVWPVGRWKIGKYYQDDFVVFLPLEMGQEKMAVRFQSGKLPVRAIP